MHGGDIYTDGHLKGKQLLDFSSNINPLGIPESFRRNLKEGIEKIQVYPDIQYRLSKSYICQYLNQDEKIKKDFIPDDLVLGNGAGEIIDLAIGRLKSICILVPAFSEYKKSAIKNGVKVVYSYLDKDMKIDYPDLAEKIKEVDGLVIGNPNNPNGGIIHQKKFMPILAYCQENNKRVIIDEAFIEFTGDGADSLLALAQEYTCLCIIKALTKFYGMPGIRFGYSVCKDRAYNQQMKGQQIPWNINGFAELALEYVLKDEAYIKQSIKWIEIERPYFIEALKQLGMIDQVYPSKANFILVKLKNLTDNQLYDQLLKKGILIRRCSNYEGLDENYVRFAIKSRQDNKRLLESLKTIKLN